MGYGRGPSRPAGLSIREDEMATALKPNMLKVVNDYIELLDMDELAYGKIGSGIIPEDMCNVRQLKELLELVGEDAIEQAVHDEEDRETAETLKDLHYRC